MLQQGGSAAQAQAEGLLVVMQQLYQTAAVRSFDDVFMVAALVTLLALLPALFIGGKSAGSGHAEHAVVLE